MKALVRSIFFLVTAGIGIQHALSQTSITGGNEDCAPPDGTLPLEFEAGGNVLRGYIDLPSSSEPSPAIVMVNGSLPTDVMAGGSIVGRQRLREAGIAYVTWDNPGSGCSEGRIEDLPNLYGRVDELLAVVERLKARDDIDSNRIGALGHSQGGWVVSMAAARSDDLAFLILLSTPGRDMTRQAAYLVRTNLALDGYPTQESNALAHQYERSQVVALAGAPYEEYLAEIERFIDHPFFQKIEALGGNVRLTLEEYAELQDSQSFLVSTDTFLSSVTIPVLAIYGEKDSWVDWREGVQVLRESLDRGGNQDFTIHALENTSHNMCLVETGSLDEFLRMDSCDQPDEFREIVMSWIRSHGFSKR